MPLHLEKTYARNCAEGRWPELAAELHAAVVPTAPAVALVQKRSSPAQKRPSSSAPEARTYVVRKGDSVASIARNNRCGSMRDIADANGLRAPHYPIKPGQVLKLAELHALRAATSSFASAACFQAFPRAAQAAAASPRVQRSSSAAGIESFSARSGA